MNEGTFCIFQNAIVGSTIGRFCESDVFAINGRLRSNELGPLYGHPLPVAASWVVGLDSQFL
ncbi:MAG: Uncharacterised protein [Flavobacteriia bacterium]|nr:MAG: Uncharacterised protein [Flavobacteriia bacterium]